MKQLQLFPLTHGGQLTVNGQTDPLHGFATQEEYDENLSIWYEVVMQNEREQEEDLQIWFDIMMKREREYDEEFRQEMYEYMDSEV